jgi:hypothetical protein
MFGVGREANQDEIHGADSKLAEPNHPHLAPVDSALARAAP